MFPSKFTEFTETFVLCQVLKDTAKHFSFKKKKNITPFYIIFSLFLQGSGPPYSAIPIPKITQPLPPPKSDCQKNIESNSSVKAASLTLVLSLFGFMAMFL